MPSKVEIIVEAKDKASGQLSAVGRAFDGIRDRITSLISANLLEDLGRSMLNFGKDAVESTVKYANQVRELQLISGQTAEESSRMIQVFDDFKISVDALTPAFRKMSSEGLTPNIETLAQLSDEFLALQTPLEKNRLLMDKFGRAGLDMAALMSKGGDAIREMAAGIDESLILTQEAVDSARNYEIALDDWNDAVEGLKIQIGQGLLPALTNQMNSTQDGIRAMEIMIEKYGVLGNQTEERRAQALAQAAAEREAASALRQVASGAESATAELAALGKTDFSADVSFILNFQTQTDNFEQKKADILAQMEEVKNEILAMEESWRWSDKEKLPGLREELTGLTGELNESEAAFKKWQKQAVFSLIQTKLAADGLTDVEFDQLMNIGEEMGVLDPAVVDQATSMVDAISSVDSSQLEDAAKNLKYIIEQDGRQVTIYVEQVVTETQGTGTGQDVLPTSGGGSNNTTNNYFYDPQFYGASNAESMLGLTE